MNEIQNIGKNYFFLVISYLINFFVGAILMVLIARIVGVEDFGKFTFAISFVSLFLILADLGLSSFSIVEIARNQTNKEQMQDYINNIFLIKLILSGLTLFLMVLLINLLQYPHDTKIIVYLMGASYILISLMEFITSLFRGIEKMEYEGLITSIKNIFLFVIVMVLLYSTRNVIFIAGGWIISMALSGLIAFFIYQKKIIKFQFKFELSLCKKILANSFYFALAPFFAVIYTNIDTVMISKMIGDTEVGYYQAAFRLIVVSVFLAANFNAVFYPVLARYYHQMKHKFNQIVPLFHKFSFILSAPILIFIIFFSREIISLVYGTKYIPSVSVLMLLAAGFFISYCPPYWNILLAIKEQKRAFFVTFFPAFINVMLNFIFIPKYGIIAAAVVTIITYTMVRAITVYFYKKLHLPIVESYLSYFYAIFCAVLLSFVLTFLLRETSVILKGILYVLFYTFIAYKFILTTKEKSYFGNLKSFLRKT